MTASSRPRNIRNAKFKSLFEKEHIPSATHVCQLVRFAVCPSSGIPKHGHGQRDQYCLNPSPPSEMLSQSDREKCQWQAPKEPAEVDSGGAVGIRKPVWET
jgi:hypothetical protein